MEKQKKDIYIFRKDLRIPYEFLKDSIFYFFWNEENFIREKRGDFFKENLKKTLRDLKINIEKNKGEMYIIEGGIIEKIIPIITGGFSGKIYIEKQYLPWEKDEEEFLLKKFPGKIEFIERNFLLTLPGEVLKDDGTPYVVFTPFYKKWQKIIYNKDFGPIEKNIKSTEVKKFFKDKVKNYPIDRDYPWKDGTSNFSKYLNLGILSPLDIFNYSLETKNSSSESEVFIRQLAWREFYYHLYYYFPYILESSFKEKYKDLYWDNNKEYFEKWTKGLTGFPFIDAAMRQLTQDGLMHNRLRMVTASFLTKDLLIDWKKGEKFFMEHLIDGDLILNNGGWQWSASTGADPQPYFRIFNPTTQSKSYDKDGEYIKKYIPELRNVPTKNIHEPWKMSIEEQRKCEVIIGADYPYPIVDHKEQRIKALELYRI